MRQHRFAPPPPIILMCPRSAGLEGCARDSRLTSGRRPSRLAAPRLAPQGDGERPMLVASSLSRRSAPTCKCGQTLNQIAGTVEIRAEADRFAAIASWWDVGPNASLGGNGSDPVGVIATVGQFPTHLRPLSGGIADIRPFVSDAGHNEPKFDRLDRSDGWRHDIRGLSSFHHRPRF
jgi:hypothetical protein